MTVTPWISFTLEISSLFTLCSEIPSVPSNRLLERGSYMKLNVMQWNRELYTDKGGIGVGGIGKAVLQKRGQPYAPTLYSERKCDAR
ncbi:hypothetical protein Trydic_g4662 [Trypoxylus dichotomus]